jgi:hypothetical protein
MPKIKNIIIFLVIAAIFVLVYIFFLKPKPPIASLVSTGDTPVAQNTGVVNTNSTLSQNFLSVLLNVKNIKLNDDIFSDNAFTSLHDSSITLTPDGTEGRINPFAPIGADSVTVTPPICTLPKVLNTATNTCVNPSLP